MIDKKKMIIGNFVLCFLAILFLGLGWNWFLKFNECNQSHNNIDRLIDNQDNLLFIYGFFAEKSLTEDRQKDLRKIIEVKEPLITTNIEHFKKKCRSGFRKNNLAFILKSYQTYLLTKQSLFKENQRKGLKWVSDNFPVDPKVFKVED